MVASWEETQLDCEDSEQSCAAIFSSGVAPDHLVTLVLTGRKSGRTASLPVVLTILDGQRYLVSMLGDSLPQRELLSGDTNPLGVAERRLLQL